MLVYARGLGDPTANAEKRAPVQVNGHPGTYATPDLETAGGVAWQYGEGSWAQVSCNDGRQRSLDVAQRVRFEVTTTRLPFTLRSLPDGYQVRGVYPPIRRSGDAILGAMDATSIDKVRDLPYFSVAASTGTTQTPNTFPAGRPTRSPGCRRCSAPVTRDCA